MSSVAVMRSVELDQAAPDAKSLLVVPDPGTTRNVTGASVTNLDATDLTSAPAP